MKKLFLFFALLAGIAVMTGCKKDQDGITLKAVFDQETKAYFGNDNRDLPYWDSDDQVNVNGTSYGLDARSVSTTFATITGVPTSEVYCAIYPANALEPGSMGTPNLTATKATIKFDPHQQYIWENNRQRVNMPMGAVTTDDDKTLIFKNLCSILRLKVSNNLGTDIVVKKLTVTSFGGYISGLFDVSLSYSSDNRSTNVPEINPSSLNNDSEDNTLTLHVPNKTVSTTDEYFDIVVPPFSARYLLLEAELLDANGKFLGYTSDTVAVVPEGWTRTPGRSIIEDISGRVSVDRNKIITVGLNVNNVNRVIKYDYGYLVPGPEFNRRIRTLIGDRTDITYLKFNRQPGDIVEKHLYCNEGVVDTTIGGVHYDTVNNHPAGWVEVQTPDSPHKIWAYIDGNTVTINSWAHFIYANTNSSEMFENLSTIRSIQWNTSREFGFQTEDVTDMSNMFKGCTNLSQITSVPVGEGETYEVLYFNTTNVTNMAHMFDGCSTLTNLRLSFNTHNVKGAGMVAMFKNCSGLQSLDISSFTTARVTNMTELFNGCAKMKDLNIYNRQFVISDTLTNMCTGLASSNTISQWDRCAIRCYGDVKDALLSQDENTNYITGIDRLKVYFPVQGENNQGQLTK